eukprot:7382882-Prymnesium_polylepis.1
MCTSSAPTAQPTRAPGPARAPATRARPWRQAAAASRPPPHRRRAAAHCTVGAGCPRSPRRTTRPAPSESGRASS